MPTVPTYSQPQVQVQNNPSVRLHNYATVGALGGDIAQGLGDVADSIERVQQKADAVAAMEAETKLHEARQKLLFDPANGAYKTKGRDALGLPAKVLPELEKQAKALEDSLITARQKMIYRQRTAAIGADTRMELERYAFKEVETFQQQQTATAKQVAGQEALRYHLDDAKVQAAIRRGQDADLLATEGMPPESTALAQRQTSSVIWREAIAMQIDDDAIGAEKRLAQLDDTQILAADREALTRLMKPKLKIQHGMVETARVLALPESKRATAIADIDDGEVQEQVIRRIGQLQSLQRQARVAREEAADDAAWKHVLSGKRWETLPAGVFSAASGSVLAQIKNHQSGGERRTGEQGWEIYEKLMTMPAKQLATLPGVAKARGYLGDTEYKQVVERYARAKNGASDYAPESTPEQQFNNTVPAMLGRALFGTAELDDSQRKTMAGYMGPLRARVMAQIEQAKKGEKYLSMEQSQRIIDEAVAEQFARLANIEIEPEGTPFAKTVKASDLEAADIPFVDWGDTGLPAIESIPASIRADMERELGPMTDEQAQRIYLLQPSVKASGLSREEQKALYNRVLKQTLKTD